MRFIILGKGKIKDVFRALALAVLADRMLEMRFGRNTEWLEPCDFSRN